MAIKINDATHNRPEGHRLVDAPAVQADLNALIKQLKEEKAWAENDRNAITVFKTHGVTAVITALHKGAEMKDFPADSLLTLQIMEGALDITHAGSINRLSQHEVLFIHGESDNQLKAVSDTVILLYYTKATGGIEGGLVM